jgi:hypothetical protein
MHLGPLQGSKIDDQGQSFVIGMKSKLHDAMSGLVRQLCWTDFAGKWLKYLLCMSILGYLA